MYDFDRLTPRQGYSVKWDSTLYPLNEELPVVPMWIADMDFPAPDCVLEAMRHRLDHPVLGYADPDPAFARAVIKWAGERRGDHSVHPEDIRYQNSVVGALVAAIQTLTEPGDPVLVHGPNYTGFTYGIADAGRRLVSSPLVRDENGVFRMDLEDMEKRIREENIKCMILCSPHNPTGRVWTREELSAASKLCEACGVYIISDEVWSDFVFAPSRHVPTALISEYARAHTITVYGATKVFNIAGMRAAYSVVREEGLRKAYHRKSAENHYNVPNTLTEAALIGGYTGGAGYVDALLDYIRGNMEYVCGYVREHIPELTAYLPEGTYVMWLDFTGTGRSDEENMARLGRQSLILSPASEYNGSNWFRMNVACPRAQVEEAMVRLKRAMEK